MSQVLSLRISEQMVERLDRFARKLGNGMTRTKASVMILEECLREADFSFVEYRDSSVGRQPYMKDSGLAIWEVIMIARRRDMDPQLISHDYPYPVENIKDAIEFYHAHTEEIDQAIEDNHIGFDGMKLRMLNSQLVDVSREVASGDALI